MKKILIAFAGMMVLFSCKQNQQGTFTVTGKIINAPTDKIFLEELPFDGLQPIVIDSATIKNGTFELKGTGNQEGIYSLSIQNGPALLMVNDSKNIKVTLDVNKFKLYQTEGSAATASLHEVFEKYFNQYEHARSFSMQLDSLQKLKAADSIITVTNLQFKRELEKLKEVVVNFVGSSASPAASLHVLTMGYSQKIINAEETKKLAMEAAAKFKGYENFGKFQQIIIAQEKASAPKENMLLNKQAPEFELAALSGDSTIKLSSFRGKYVLVDFWASWCGPCRRENPTVVAAYNKYKNKNFTILGVSLDKDKKSWATAVTADGLTWSHVSDLKQWESPMVGLYNFSGIPFNVLVDPNGKIIAAELRGDALEKKLAEVLK